MTLLIGDRALLDGFRRGDDAALERVYAHYAEAVARVLTYGFAFSVGGRRCRFGGFKSRFDLEDTLQEVFARAFSERGRSGYDGLSPYQPYLFAIARNTVIDGFRKQRVAVDGLGDETVEGHAAEPSDNAVDVLDGAVAPSGDPAKDLANAELATLVADVKDSFSADEALVFRLRFDEGMSLPEAEAASGKTASQLKTLERRLRERVLDRIWESGYLDGYRTKEGSWLHRLLRRPARGGPRRIS